MKKGLTIGLRIGGGFGIVLLLLIVVAFFSLRGLIGASTGFEEYRGTARSTNLAGRIQANMLTARLHANTFIRTNKPESIDACRERLGTVLQLVEENRTNVHTDSHIAIMNDTESGSKAYRQAFDQVVQYMAQRDALVSGVLTPEGIAAERALTEILTTARQDNDMEAAYEASLATRALLLARLYAARFLESNDEASVVRVNKEFEALAAALRQLDAKLEDEQRRQLLGNAQTSSSKYKAGFDEVVRTINDRNELIHGTLDRIGPKVAEDLETMKLEIQERQDTLGPQMVASNDQARLIAMIASGAALLMGVGIALLITRSLVRPIRGMVDRLKDIAQGEGDLTQRVDQTRKDELGELAKWFNTFVQKVHDIIAEVAATTSDVASSSTQIAASSEEIAAGMKEQNDQVAQISSAIEEMSSSVREVAQKSTDAAKGAGESGDLARNGGGVVEKTIEGMRSISDAVNAGAESVRGLGRRGEQIGEIIEVINDIADQTNLLALNAAIEAARAGEHGRGFAVVADEVRKLADRTTKATEEIAQSIQAIQEETSQAVERMEAGTAEVTCGVELAGQAGDSLTQIVTSAEGVASMVQSIAAAAEEQSAAAEQVARNVEQISAVTKQASEGVSQAATAASQLSVKAEQLQRLVGQFKLANR